MKYVKGTIYKEDGKFIKGYIGFQDGIIQEIGKHTNKKVLAEGVIIPTFVNAHTHIGDSIISVEPQGTIKELVAPPNGLKHKILKEAKDEQIVDAMHNTMKEMLLSGTSHFSDFREEGIRGISQLQKALSNLPIQTLTMGRPKKLEYHKNEITSILKECGGIGVSSIMDWEYTELEKIAKHTKRENKIFALHASEAVREDIDQILDLKPNFLVHMIQASDSDLEICANNNVPIVVCPRSNAFFSMLPNIPRMLGKKLLITLGTDNVMISTPSMFREMEFTYRISKAFGGVNADNILHMTLLYSRKVLNIIGYMGIQEGAEANFMVLNNIPARNPAYHIVTRSCARHISLINIGEFSMEKKGTW